MIPHDWPCVSTQKTPWFSSDFGGTPSTQKWRTKRHLGETKFSDRAEFSRTSSKALMCGWVNGGWWCFFWIPTKLFGSIWMMVLVDDIFLDGNSWGAVPVSVLGLYLFLCSLATCFYFVWIRSTPPLPSTTTTPPPPPPPLHSSTPTPTPTFFPKDLVCRASSADS